MVGSWVSLFRAVVKKALPSSGLTGSRRPGAVRPCAAEHTSRSSGHTGFSLDLRSQAARVAHYLRGEYFMLHHVSVGVSDVERAAKFYDAALGALGDKRVM